MKEKFNLAAHFWDNPSKTIEEIYNILEVYDALEEYLSITKDCNVLVTKIKQDREVVKGFIRAREKYNSILDDENIKKTC